MMENDLRKRVLCTLAAFLALLLPAVVSGCTMPELGRGPSRNPAPWLGEENQPLQYKVKEAIRIVITGTEEESSLAEKKLKEEFKQAALPWLYTELEGKYPEEIMERLIDVYIEVRLRDASSIHEQHRADAVKSLVNLDKKFGVIDQLLVHLEEADQKLSNSIFQVLERREYISALWGWPDQAWQELSERLAGNVDVIKCYVAYKLADLPTFDLRTMNWDDYDAEHCFTVLSEMVKAECYTDLAPLFVDMLNALAPRIRWQAANVLGHLGHKGAAEKLTSMLTEDKEPVFNVRAAAAEALGRMKAAEEASTTLIALLTTGELLGSRVCWALGELESRGAVIALIRILEEQPAAMVALGKIGNELAVKPLVRALKETDPRVRTAAAWALGNFKTNDALQALKRRYPVEPVRDTRNEIAFALFKIDPSDSHKALVKALKSDPDDITSLTARTLLTSKGDIENISAMMEIMEKLTPDRREPLWKIIMNSFDGMPEYHPYGLNYRRTADIEAINKWFTENRARFYWDETAHKLKVR